jgi:hypothetical protein
MIEEGKGDLSPQSPLPGRELACLRPDQSLAALRYVEPWPIMPVVSRADFPQLEGTTLQQDVLDRYRAPVERFSRTFVKLSRDVALRWSWLATNNFVILGYVSSKGVSLRTEGSSRPGSGFCRPSHLSEGLPLLLVLENAISLLRQVRIHGVIALG